MLHHLIEAKNMSSSLSLPTAMPPRARGMDWHLLAAYHSAAYVDCRCWCILQPTPLHLTKSLPGQ